MNRFSYRAGLLCCAMVCMAATVFAQEDGVEYKIKLKGAKDGEVKKAVKESTMAYKLRKRPPSTVGQLRRRLDKDMPLIESILESRGYYDGTVVAEIDQTRDPVRVTIRVEQGERYEFRKVELRFSGEADPALQKIKPLIRPKRSVVAARVFAEQQRILDLVKREGYPFPTLVKRAVEVDRANRTVDLALEFDPGVRAYFGEVRISGLERLPEKYVKRQVPWKPGEQYDSHEVDEFERKLLSTGVFGSARVDPLEPEAGTNAIPVGVVLSERDLRTVRLGVGYSDVGPDAKVYLEHRSLFGGGERLETTLSWSPVKTGVDGALTRLGFLDARQSLVLDASAYKETPDAYDSQKLRGSAMVLRDFTSKIQGGAGMGYQRSHVEQFDASDRYSYLFFPVQAAFDNRDDRLNPVRGAQLFGRTAYYEDMSGNESFLKSGLEGRHYAMLWSAYRLSSALRLTLGSIDGASVEAVPADERFYAGGGGSIRGYEYQSVGPRLDDTPTGGDRLLEMSAELRLQPGPRLGYALFVDGGTVYNDLFDDGNRALRFGAGAGLRWFTTIGPLRADLAFPLNPDSGQVERLQFYISLGQAF